MDTTLLTSAIQNHQWAVATGAFILIIVYLSKLPAFGAQWNRIPKKYRPLVVVGLGVASGVAQALVARQPWLPALLSNGLAALVAIGADQAATKPMQATSVVWQEEAPTKAETPKAKADSVPPVAP
jgi:hypothetical protein